MKKYILVIVITLFGIDIYSYGQETYNSKHIKDSLNNRNETPFYFSTPCYLPSSSLSPELPDSLSLKKREMYAIFNIECIYDVDKNIHELNPLDISFYSDTDKYHVPKQIFYFKPPMNGIYPNIKLIDKNEAYKYLGWTLKNLPSHLYIHNKIRPCTDDEIKQHIFRWNIGIKLY